MLCNSGNIVVVPFPFVDNANIKPRPALIVSSKNFNEAHDHSVMAMVTTGISTKWESDIEIIDLKLAGLPVKSFVRLKMFTLDNRLIKKIIGQLDAKSFTDLKNNLSSYLCN